MTTLFEGFGVKEVGLGARIEASKNGDPTFVQSSNYCLEYNMIQKSLNQGIGNS